MSTTPQPLKFVRSRKFCVKAFRPSTLILLVLSLTAVVKSTAQSKGANGKKGEEAQNSLLWQISGKGLKKPSYLFGTYHLMNSNFIDTEAPKLAKLIPTLDGVMGELKLGDATKNETSAFKLFSFKADTPMAQRFTDAEFDKLRTFFEKSDFPFEIVAGLKPMVAYTYLMLMMYNESFSEDNVTGEEVAIDEYVQDLADHEGKQTAGLESSDFQMEVLNNSIPEWQQSEMVKHLLNNPNAFLAEMTSMREAYMTQNLPKLHAMIAQSDDMSPETEKIMVTNRNKNWIPIIDQKIKSGPWLFAFGAGHLLGKEGVIELLRAQGYKVKAISTK